MNSRRSILQTLLAFFSVSAARSAETVSDDRLVQPAPGAIDRSIAAKLRELELADTDFGADVQGTRDATAAIRSLLAAVQVRTMSGNNGVYGSGAGTGTAPVVKLPSGVRRIEGPLTPDAPQALNYRRVLGEDTLLVAIHEGITVFGGVGYQTWFEGVVFRGGGIALSYRTANVDGTRGGVFRCEFHRQNDACIQTDGNSNSSILVFTLSKFMQDDPAGKGLVARILSGDFVKFSDSWITCHTPVAFDNRGGLTLKDCIAVDGGRLERWIDNRGSLEIDNFQFGGHAAGRPLVRNYAETLTDNATSTRIALRNLEAFSNGPLIEFQKLPNVIELENIKGMANAAANVFQFASTLTAADFLHWQRHGQLTVRGVWTGGLGPAQHAIGTNVSEAGDIGRKVFLAHLARTGQIDMPRRTRLRVAELRGSGHQEVGWRVIDYRTRGTYDLDAYGVGANVLTASADQAEHTSALAHFLKAAVLPYGTLLTLIQIVDVQAEDGADVALEVGGARKFFHLGTGKHILDVPFVYLNDTAKAHATCDAYSYTVRIRRAGGVVRVGRHLLTRGLAQYAGEVLVLEGVGPPVAYVSGIATDHGYFRGDMIYRTNVIPGEPWAEFCTTSGSPGVWKGAERLAK